MFRVLPTVFLAISCSAEVPASKLLKVHEQLAEGEAALELEQAWLALGAAGEVWSSRGLLAESAVEFSPSSPDTPLAAHLSELAAAGPLQVDPLFPNAGLLPALPLHLWIHPDAEVAAIGSLERIASGPDVRLRQLSLHGLISDDPIQLSLPLDRAACPPPEPRRAHLHIHASAPFDASVDKAVDPNWAYSMYYEVSEWEPGRIPPIPIGYRMMVEDWDKDLVVQVRFYEGVRWFHAEPVLRVIAGCGFEDWSVVWNAEHEQEAR